MTPEENALLARLDGWKQTFKTTLGLEIDIINHPLLPDYDNLISLMPLAWKYGVDCDQELDGTWSAKAYLNKDKPLHGVLDITDADPKIAIQQALLAIAREKFSE